MPNLFQRKSSNATAVPSDLDTASIHSTNTQYASSTASTDPLVKPDISDVDRQRGLAQLKWGVAAKPTESRWPRKPDGSLPDDHPVHAISMQQREKWQKQGINPVSRAEMDATIKANGGSSKWAGGGYMMGVGGVGS